MRFCLSGRATDSRDNCGDAACEPYTFIGNPVFTPHTVDEMREAFLSFFEKNGHTRIERYPVAARWRDDIYLTIASIADFQPFVTSGIVPPPANPLTISQPCIRLNDLDSVGKSGRHLTTFEMLAHHAFNTPDGGDLLERPHRRTLRPVPCIHRRRYQQGHVQGAPMDRWRERRPQRRGHDRRPRGRNPCLHEPWQAEDRPPRL